MTPAIHTIILDDLTLILKQTIEHSFSIYTYLHTLELFNRLVHILFTKAEPTIESIKPYLYICLNCAYKLSPAVIGNYGLIKIRQMIGIHSLKIVDIISLEINAVKLLNGDMYPQIGGFLDQVFTKILSYNETDRFIFVRKIFNEILDSSKEIHMYTNIDITDEDRLLTSSVDDDIKYGIKDLPKV